MFEYPATAAPSTRDPLGVVDGDTMNVVVSLGLDISIGPVTLRMYGINAPEVSTAAGRAAKVWAIAWFTQHCPNGTYTIQTVKSGVDRDKYGRYLATIIAPDGAVYNTDAVTAGQAVPYFPKEIEGDTNG